MQKKGHLFIISGPSGSGKTTLTVCALEYLKKNYSIKQAITYTTRAARAGEVNGYDYYFITEQEFKNKIDKNDFLEWSTWYGAYYGTSIKLQHDLLKGTSYIIILDRQGAKSLKRLLTDAHTIWIQPASLELLKERLTIRGKNTAAEVEERIEKACIEIEQEKREHFYEKIINNDHFNDSCNELVRYIEKKIKEKTL